jgi:phage/plasmid-like protein (TIGR03299 family)
MTKSGSFSIIRDDNEAILHSQALERYTPVQNIEAFKFMDGLVRFAGDITYETAGALGQGETTFVTAKLPGYIRIGQTNDVIEKFIIWTNSHSGGALSLFLSDVRVVCQNTLSAAFQKRSNYISLKHTKNILNSVKEAADMMGLIRDYNDEFGKILNELVKLQVTETVEKNLVNSLFLTPDEIKALGTADGISTKKQNIIGSVRNAIHSAPGQDQHVGTAFWLYNGITSYFQNVKKYKSLDRKMVGINLGGDEAITRQRAFNQLTAMLS